MTVPRFTDRVDVTRACTQALSGLDEVIWQATEMDLSVALAACGELVAVSTAAAYALTREAVARGEVAASQAGSLYQWVRENAPALPAETAAEVARAVPLLGRSGAEDFDAAVRTGRVSPRVGVTCANEWVKLQAHVTEAGTPLVRESLLVVGAADGSREVRKLRPALLAQYGLADELDREQADAATHVSLAGPRDEGGGLHGYELVLDDEGKAVLEAAIGPLSAPAPTVDPQTGAVGRDPRTAAQRRGQSLVEALRRSTHIVGAGGGVGSTSTVFVAVGLAELLEGRGAGEVLGSLASGTLLGPETVHRLGCDATLLAGVLGSQGEPLALGRAARCFTSAQRKALWVRDRGCTFPGCQAPAAWCDAHHLVHWAEGGPTDLDNAALLCGRHHTVVHRDHLRGRVEGGRVVWSAGPAVARAGNAAVARAGDAAVARAGGTVSNLAADLDPAISCAEADGVPTPQSGWSRAPRPAGAGQDVQLADKTLGTSFEWAPGGDPGGGFGHGGAVSAADRAGDRAGDTGANAGASGELSMRLSSPGVQKRRRDVVRRRDARPP